MDYFRGPRKDVVFLGKRNCNHQSVILAVRQNEAQDVLKILGVPEKTMVFLGMRRRTHQYGVLANSQNEVQGVLRRRVSRETLSYNSWWLHTRHAWLHTYLQNNKEKASVSGRFFFRGIRISGFLLYIPQTRHAPVISWWAWFPTVWSGQPLYW